jgi:uncharacterized membrane protein
MYDAFLILHVASGAVGLLTGYVALYATKGARLHRRVGAGFVAAMLAMCVGALLVMALDGRAPIVNVFATLLTAYPVVTALSTVRPPPPAASRALDFAAMLVALVVGVTSLAYGLEAVALGGSRNGTPAFPFLMFGTIGLLAAAGDLRMIRSGGLRGAPRVARHLWRMCFALFIAALSFFLGQANVIPAAVRIPALLALPVLAVFVTMLYWLWRVRVRQSLRGITSTRVSQVA